MRKRIMAVLLSVLMILPVFLFSSCGGGATSTIVQLERVTVTLYTITDEKTTEDGIASVQEAINEYTEPNFGTHVVLKMFTADEYDSIVEERLAAMKDSKSGSSSSGSGKKGEYPAAKENQVDIFLINSIDMFNKYSADGSLRPLNDFLGGAYAILNKHINGNVMQSSVFLSSAAQCALPNNCAPGEFEFILLNKKVCDDLGYYAYTIEDENYDLFELVKNHEATVQNIADLKSFIDDVAKNEPEYAKIIDTYGMQPYSVLIGGAGDFYGSYTKRMEPLSVNVNAATDLDCSPDFLFNNKDFKKDYLALCEMRKNNYFVEGEVPEGDAKAAAVFVKGNENTIKKYKDDYYVSIYKYPTATNENVYDSMYGISAYSKHADRCMQIISALQTDAKLRNLFQYGKEDVDYDVNEDGLIEMINEEYVMNPRYTGNQFLLYPNADMTEDELAFAADDWAMAKKQNLYMVVSPYYGFSALSTVAVFEEPNAPTINAKFEKAIESEKKDKDKPDAEPEPEGTVHASDITVGEDGLTPEVMLAYIKEFGEKAKARVDAYEGNVEELFSLEEFSKVNKNNAIFKLAYMDYCSDSPRGLYTHWKKMKTPPEEEETSATSAQPGAATPADTAAADTTAAAS